jgi:hypothetical protein
MSTALSTIQNLATQMAAVAPSQSQGEAGASYMKMTKFGEWVHGREDLEVQEGSTWAIHPQRFAKGFVAWKDGQIAGEKMAFVLSEPVVLSSDLPEVGATWKTQMAMQLLCMSGEDKGTPVLWKASSAGANKAYDAIFNKILVKAQAGELKVMPVVELETEHYKHKDFGKIYNPILKVVDWLEIPSESPTAEAEPKVEAEVEKVEKVVEEVKEVKEAPKKRRRRSAA